MEDVSFKMIGHWGHLDMYKWSYGQKFTCKFVKFWAYWAMQQVADKMNFQDPVQKYAECHSWDMSNSNATKYHEIKVGILDNTCFKENVPTFEILVGWILRLGLNFWVINVALYGWKCDPAYHSTNAVAFSSYDHLWLSGDDFSTHLKVSRFIQLS